MVQTTADVELWFHLDPPSKVASFRVVAQGSTPGLQTVPRSEMAAVVWAAQWGLQSPDTLVTAYTDAQGTFNAVQALKQGLPPDRTGPASDLEVQLPDQALARLQVVKVKAHTDQAWSETVSAQQQWLCLGNEAADRAAKAARGQELQAVLQYSDNIAEHVKFQETHMVAFARYLVQLNVADARLRETCATPEPPLEGTDHIRQLVHDTWQAWTQWDPQPFWVPEIDMVQHGQTPDGDPLQDYELSLLQWARDLRWPVRPAPTEQDATVTFYELFTNFLVFSRLLPPVKLEGAEAIWISRSTIRGQAFPVTVLQLVMEFRDRLRSLEARLKTDLLFAVEVPGLSLGPYGVGVPLLGLDATPRLKDVQTWLPHHLLMCRQFSSGAAHMFSFLVST